VSGKALSAEDGYTPATNYATLDKVLYDVVKELRETIQSLETKITTLQAMNATQEIIINELKNGGGGGGGKGGLSFAEIAKGKATAAYCAAVVAIMTKETK
jgi:hypothetical protein